MATFNVERARRAGMPEAEIQQFMKERGLRPTKSVSGFLQNIPRSAGALVSGIGEAIANPIQTLTNIGNVAMGAAQLVMPGKQDKEKFARALGQFYVDRYGSPEKALDTLYSDPVGALSDVSTFLTGGGAAISGIGKVSRLGGVAKTGQAVSRIGAMAEPLNIVGAGLGKLPGKGLMKRAGGKIEEMGREYAKTGYGQPATLGKYAQRYRPVEDVITEYGLYGKDTEKLAKTINSIQNEFDKIAKRSGRQVKLSDLKGSVKNKITELQTSGVLEDIKTADAIKERLNIFQKSLKKTSKMSQAQFDEYASKMGEKMYHGTKSKFKTFDDTKFGTNTEWLNANWGHFFTKDKKIAKSFLQDEAIKNKPGKSRIIEATVDIKKPLDFRPEGIRSNAEQAQIIYEALTDEKTTKSKALKFVKNAFDEAQDLGELDDFYNEIYGNLKIKELAQQKGYDGLIAHYGKLDNKNIDEYVAFSSKQIRTIPELKKEFKKTQAPKEIGVDLATEMRKKYDQRVKNWNEPVTDVDANRILRDIFQDEIRKATADLATAKGENLKRTGERLSELYALEPIMQQAAQRGTSTRAFSLGKMVTSGVGATMAGLPGAIAGYGLDVIANQPKVIGAASKATQKIGQAMQKGMPKMPALEKVGQGANIFYQAGKVGRVTAPAGKTETMPTMTPEEERQKRIDDAILRYAPSYEKIKQKRTKVSPGNAFSKVGKVSKGSFV